MNKQPGASAWERSRRSCDGRRWFADEGCSLAGGVTLEAEDVVEVATVETTDVVVFVTVAEAWCMGDVSDGSADLLPPERIVRRKLWYLQIHKQ